MNKDLENELMENPELAAVVGRLRAAREVEVRSGEVFRCETKGRAGVFASRIFRYSSSLLAASILAAIALSFWFKPFPPDIITSTSLAYGAREYRLSPEEMIASQNADGSWQNDFLTRRNAEALRTCSSPGAQVAFKKAMRNLRCRGIL